MAGFLISIYTNNKNDIERYHKYYLFFIQNYISEKGILLFEKSNNYQALFIKWNLQFYILIRSFGYTSIEIDNITKKSLDIISNYRKLLQHKIFIGDITPDVSNYDLINSLNYYENIINNSFSHNKENLIDIYSGHYFFNFDFNSFLYYISNESNNNSHFHYSLNNFVLFHNNYLILGDIGRTNYTNEYNWMINREFHNNISLNFKNVNFEPILIFNSNSNNEITFSFKPNHLITNKSKLTLLFYETEVILKYFLESSNDFDINLRYVLNKNFVTLFDYSQLEINSIDSVISSSDYGEIDDLFNIILIKSKIKSYTYNFDIKLKKNVWN